MAEPLISRAARWLQDNQDKAGTETYARIAKTFKQLRSEQPQATVGSEEWRAQMTAQGLDVGEESGPPSDVGTPAWQRAGERMGVDRGVGNVPRDMGPVGGRGGPITLPDLAGGGEIPFGGGGALAAMRGTAEFGSRVAGIPGKLLGHEPTGESPEEFWKEPEDPTVGERVGRFAGDVAPYAGVPGGTSVKNAMAIGSGIRALESGGDPEEAALGAAEGLVGHGAGRALERGIRGGRALTRRLSNADETELISQQAEDLGFLRSKGQARNATPRQKQREAALKSDPNTSGGLWNITTHNAQTGNRITGRALGLPRDVEYMTPGVLGEAVDGIGARYTRALDGQKIPVDDTTLDHFIAAIDLGKGTHKLSPERMAKVDKYVDEFMDAVDGNSVDGLVYNDIRARIGKDTRRLYKTGGDYEQAEVLDALQQSMDDMAERGLPQENTAALREARRQWRTLLHVEKPGVLNGRGEVSLKTLHNKFNESSKAYKRGRGNLTDLEVATRFAAAHPSIVGDSGTATRSSKTGPIKATLGAIEGAVNTQTAGQRVTRAAPRLPGIGAYAATRGPLAQEQATGEDPLQKLADGPLGQSGLAQSPLNPYRRSY